MPDGFKTTLTFASKPGIALWEQSIKPPSIDGGGPIPTTTMLNVRVRTQRAKKLYTYSAVSGSFAFDPDVMIDIIALVNAEQAITLTWPDGSTMAFWGYLDKFEPGEQKEGDMPMAGVTVEITNWDPVNNVEAEAVYAAAAGT
jgi:hypothetical protein